MGERSLPRAPTDVFYARMVASLTTFVLGYLLYWVLQPFLGPIIRAMFLAFLLSPLHRSVVHRLNGRKSISAILLTVATLALLIGPIADLYAAFNSHAEGSVDGAQNLLARNGSNSLQLTQVPGLNFAAQWRDRDFSVRGSGDVGLGDRAPAHCRNSPGIESA